MKVFVALFLTILALNSVQGKRNLPSYSPGKRYDQYECQTKVCPYGYFNCDCEKSRKEYLNSTKCIPSSWMCDGHSDCADGSDEIDCVCGNDEMQCSVCKHGGGCSGNVTLDLYQCSSKSKISDGEVDCLSSKDEHTDSSLCNPCNGIINCPHLKPHDESNCLSCPDDAPNRCACNSGNVSTCQGAGHVCYSDNDRCNGVVDCSDASDELNCPCAEDEFMCECYNLSPPRCYGTNRCIPKEKYHDNKIDCPDGSDESHYFREVRCGQCDVKVYRLADISECNSPACDNSTCYKTSSLACSDSEYCNVFDVICTSFCPNGTSNECNRGFQCADGTLALLAQFCDGNIDCPDNSDEVRKRQGFTCEEQARNCVLPQKNIYDDISHCDDRSDLCADSQSQCFQCYDKRLFVSSKQVCNGVVDCYDYSDECLCENSSEIPFCKSLSEVDSSSNLCGATSQINHETNVDQASAAAPVVPNNVITCQTKWGNVLATLCDGRPQCPDFSDECSSCFSQPPFCSDLKHGGCNSKYRLGDRYCDGVEDGAWNIIDSPQCPKGFDEKNCPKRFYCKAGHRMSIDVSQVCDGKVNCDDGLDEKDCNSPSYRKANEASPSSKGEMIKAPGLKYIVWIMAFVIIFANIYVIRASFKRMRKEKIKQSIRFQYLIFLNIGIGDMIMGWYLLALGVKSAMFGDTYNESDDNQWRTSTACSVIGSFVLISSEAVCFLMVLLMAFLLYNTLRPSYDGNSKCMKKLLGAGIFTAWLAAILLAIVPILDGISDHFVQNIWMVNPFSNKSVMDFSDARDFSCRIASLKDEVIKPNDWSSVSSFLSNNFPEASPVGKFGYYSSTSLCMPRLFVSYGERSWQYTFIVITANFISYLFISLTFLANSKLQLREETGEEEEPFDEQDEKMQRRIARVIFTNVVAWLIIIVLVYIGISGVNMSYTAHIVTAIVLVPINSILNPILFSALAEKPSSVLCL